MNENRTPVLATLRVVHASGTQQLVSLKNGDSVQVGRSSDSDVVIDDPIVSREHATFDCTSYGVVIADLASSNGTFLNGSRLTTMKDLSQDDVVDIGSAKISISWRTVGSLQKKTSEKALRAKTAQLKRVSVTVLVSRAQAYREMLQKIAAHDAEATLSSWMNRVQDIIFRFGGCTDKTIEETVVALWVGDQAQAQGERAALAAQAILSASKTFDAEWRRAAQTPWRSSVVVASGHGLAGSVGAANEGRRFAMIGDPVNLAFALESEIQNFDTQIIFDDLTVRAIEATIPTRLIGHSTKVERGIEVPIFSLK